jgi:hypothetical protein
LLVSSAAAAGLCRAGSDLLGALYARLAAGSVLNKEQVLKDLREQVLLFHRIDNEDPLSGFLAPRQS